MKTRTKFILIALTLVGVVSCANLVPRQGWSRSLGPVVPHDSFPADCAMCHEGGSWDRIKPDFEFDHEKETGVPLMGAHAQASCLMCHNDRGPVKQFSDRGCSGCHEDVHRGRQGASCESCHNQNTWRPLESITMHARTRFALVGAHAAAECTSCHTGARNNNFEMASIDCESCHAADAGRSTAIDHAVMGFTSDCQRCHNATGWLPADFDHPSTFPLSAGHAGVSCNQCHTTPGVFTGLSTSCVSCHQQDFNSTTDPNHAAAGFTTDCTQCHNTNQWQGATFQHTPAFALTNGHAGRQCSDCHARGVYTGLSSDCASCHLGTFQSTTNPNHTSAGFGTNCTQCHNTTRWQGAHFTHPATFPLTNAHANRSCTACHTTPGVYTGLSTTCVSCHQADYNTTTAPAHAAAGFSTDCTQCHNTTLWQGATFQHTQSFPLSNGHAGRSCTACHTTPGVYTGLDTACASCHLDDFQRVTDPNHVTGGFSTTCTECHNTSQWQGASFQHTQTFPLTLGHSGVSCTRCHTTPGVYTGLNTACVSCHQTDFNQTTDPNHTAAGFSTNCTLCHSTGQWLGAVFTHPASFPLSLGHANRTCNQCHTTPGTYSGLSTACSACHLDDYQSTTDPHHAAAGFSTNCTQCHNTTQWPGATFTHTTAFPLTLGHANHACSTCHTTPGTYASLTSDCAQCHMPEYNATTNPNHAQSGFPTSCVSCHNTSNWNDATFSHPRINRGNHSNLSCADCHTVPSTTPAFSCTHCHEHNQQDMANDHQGRSGYQWLSSACYNCHD